MGLEQDIQFICENKLVAVVRLDHPDMALQVAERLAGCEVRIIEITLTTPRACDVIADLTAKMGGDILVGAGTCTTVDDVRKVVQAGARFVVSPCFFPPMVKAINDAGAVSIPGCFTPTEVLCAHRAGAAMVKLFPASLGGPGYVRTLRGLFPKVKLIPTGGIKVQNAGEFIDAGAAAVGVGGNLVKRRTEDETHLAEMAVKAATLLEAIAGGPKKRFHL